MDKILKYLFALNCCLVSSSAAAYQNNKMRSNATHTYLNYTYFNDDSLSKPVQFHFTLEFSPAIASYSRVNSSIRFISGYSFSKNHFIGLGAGTTVYPTKYNNLIYSKFRFYPVFIRYSKAISVKGIMPMIYGDIGSQIQVKVAKEQSLLFYRFGIGLNYYIKKRKIGSSIEYSRNKARFTHNYYSSPELGYWYNNNTFSICINLILK